MKIKKGRKNRGITSTLRSIALVPTVCMGIGSLIIASFIVYFYMTEETRDGLHNLAHSLYHTCMLAGEGDYSVEGGILFKGDNPFDTGFSIIDNIHSVSGVDATIFYGDERKATSIRKDDGTRASGTLAAPEVVRTVLKGGEDYFSEKVLVNNTPYFGYYIPLRNSDESIVGMVFVGKPRQLVIKAVMHEILMIFLLIASIGAIAMVVSLRYANNVIFSLNKIKEYLGCVAQGNVDAQISQGLAERRDEIGEMARFTCVLQKSITSLVGTDTLTGLYNRRSGGMILTRNIREFLDYRTPFTVAMGDIDSFKQINDQYGHSCGDIVLRQLAVLFTEHMGRKGFVIRWGGEEFLFIYERMERARAISYLEELQDTLHSTDISFCDRSIKVTMTFGTAEYTDKFGNEIEKLIRVADSNLYYGKEHGKDRVI